MEEIAKRNGKWLWMREIEKVLKRFDTSLEWLTGIIAPRDEEIESVRWNEEMDERDKNQMLRAKKMKSIADVLEDVEVVIDMHFFVEFSQTVIDLSEKSHGQSEID